MGMVIVGMILMGQGYAGCGVVVGSGFGMGRHWEWWRQET